MIEENHVGGNRSRCARNLLQLAFADQRGGIGPVAMLHEFAGDLGAGAGRQRAQFVERLLGAEIRRIGAPAGGDAGGMIASCLRPGGQRRPVGLSGAAARAELYPDKKRALAAFRWIQHCLGLISRTAPVSSVWNHLSASILILSLSSSLRAGARDWLLSRRWSQPQPVSPRRGRAPGGR